MARAYSDGDSLSIEMPPPIRRIKVDLCDTAGQVRFRTNTTSHYRQSHGIVIVYDIMHADEFESLPKWLHECRTYAPTDTPILIYGSKTDLATSTRARAVSAERARDFAHTSDCQYAEGSALVGSHDVELAVASLVERIIGANPLYTPPIVEHSTVYEDALMQAYELRRSDFANASCDDASTRRRHSKSSTKNCAVS